MIKLQELFKEKMHPVVKTLLITNVLSITGWAFVNPIFAVYVINNIKGGSLEAIGICWFIYWLVKAILQIFVSDSLDKVDGESDDYFTLLLGQFLVILVPLALLFSKNASELYFIFLIYGIADALYVPPWNSIFTRYINPRRISFQWALNSTGYNLGSAFAILIGSFLALTFGFPLIFVIVFLVQVISLVNLLSIKKYFLHKKKEKKEYFFPLKG